MMRTTSAHTPAMARLAWISLALAATVNAFSWTATPLNPASVPLAVRTPYLSTWLPQGAGTALNAAWPTFWTGSVTGWAGYVRVDNVVYTFLGTPGVPNVSPQAAVQKSFKYTTTQSTFVMTAGGIDLTVNFLSPIETSDLVKQSTPFSYLSLVATPNDGKSHSVQVYTDISAEWVSGDNSLTAKWNSTTSGSVLTHQVQLQTPSQFKEVNDHTQYGAAYYSTPNSASATYQTGQDTVVRAAFINNGVLPNTQDTNFRAISNNWPVFGFAHNLGTVSAASAPVLFSVGHVRDPALQYETKSGLQNRSSYFWSKYSSVLTLISDFLTDYPSALSRANTLDAQVQSDAGKISTNYAALAALSLRQAMGATEITISKSSSGAWNTSDVLMFLKEISSDGNVNTVDVIFPAWPAYIYLNPSWAKYLLLPLFEYQATGLYPNAWAVHDMGASYPVANGHNDGSDEKMPVEESGNMLIMALSYTQKTGDNSLIQSYTKLLDQWTQFLIQDSLIPQNQISTDDFAGALANQTNLAIKGITGIKAMSVIQGLLGNTAKSSNYSTIASNYATQFLKLGGQSTTGSHLTLAYGSQSSWGMAYNLWADKHLKLNLFSSTIYSEQTAWYPTVEQAYGLPLDTRHSTTWTKSDWQIFTASTVTDTTVRNHLVDLVVKYVSNGLNNVPLSDWYDASSGKTLGFQARPVVGGHLALLTV